VIAQPNAIHLEEAKERWIQKKKPFTAEFLCHDPKTEDLSTILSPESFNVVASFDGLQHSFESESKYSLLSLVPPHRHPSDDD
jgi:hypothetical protein